MRDYDDKLGECDSAAAITGAVVGVFLRQLDAASTCTVELHRALAARDRRQVLALIVSLYRAWNRASARVVQLGALSGTVEAFARDALATAHTLAAEPLARAEALLLHGPLPSAHALGLADSRDYD